MTGKAIRVPLARRWRRWEFAACLLLVLLLAGNLDLLVGKRAPQWDTVDFFGPEFSLVADHIKAGRLLIWDPWTDAGIPDFAEPELGTTSPILLLIAFFSPKPQAGFVAYWIVIWILGGLGVLLLARYLKSPAWGGLVAALSFVSSGFFTGHAEHTSSLWSIAMLPWIIWRFDAALLARKYWFAVQAGVFYGLSALGGYPQFTILTPLFLILWAIGRVLLRETTEASQQKSPLGRALLLVTLCCLITGCIGAVIYSPSYTGIVTSTPGFTDRAGYRSRQEAISSNILPVQAFSTLSSPYLAALNLPPNPIWPVDVSMASVYMGAAVIVLGCFALRRGNAWRWWLLGIAGFFAACSIGDQFPVRGWLYDFLPPTRFFRNASMFSAYAIFVFTVLASMGARDIYSLKKRSKERGTFCALSILVGLTALAISRHVLRSTSKVSPSHNLAVAQIVIIWLGIVAISIAFYSGTISKRAAGGLILAVSIFDAIATFRITQPIMYTESSLSWWHIMNAKENRNLDLKPNGLTRVFQNPEILGTLPSNRNLPLKIPILNSYVTLKNRFAEKINADPVLREMALGSERIWFCSDSISSPINSGSFERFAKRVHTIERPVLFLHSPDEMRTLAPRTAADSSVPVDLPDAKDLAACSPAAISQLSYWPNWLSFNYSAAAQGWLLVTDRWAPGWSATVNGQPKDIFGADFIFRAIYMNPGVNHIAFRYKPSGFFVSLIASWTTLALVLLVQLLGVLDRRRSSRLGILRFGILGKSLNRWQT